MQPEHGDPPPKRGLSRVLIAVIGFVVLSCVLGWGVVLPALQKYRRRALTTEAIDHLARLYRASGLYAAGAASGAGGSPLVPASAPVTPATVPPGVRVVDAPGTWNHPTWRALNFEITDPHYYSCQYDSDGQHQFTARALGDLDGDGVYSTFERAGQIQPTGEVTGSRAVWMNRETE